MFTCSGPERKLLLLLLPPPSPPCVKKKKKVGSSAHWRPEHAARPAAARGAEWATLEGGCVGEEAAASSPLVTSPHPPVLYTVL